jgi:predicted permease
MSRVEAVHVDGSVSAFALGLILACALFACSVSSLSVQGDRILSALQESSPSQSAGSGRVKLRKALLMLEVTLTAVLLIGAGLLLESYQRLRSANLGCITKKVLTMGLSLPEVKYSQGVQRANFFQSLLDRVRALPGVEGAGLVRDVPGQGCGGHEGFAITGHPPLPEGKAQYAIMRWADPGYFAALGTPFLRGQTFDEDQKLGKADEVVVSESFARQYFPSEDPIGKHLITLGGHSFRIVGTVGDTRYLASASPLPIMYFPVYGALAGWVPSDATLAVHSSRDVSVLALPIQQIIQRLDPQLAVSDILTMDQLIGKSTLDASFDATLMLAFAVLSLTLAAVGLFGVLSYVVAQRTQEIGIRMALGAQRRDVLRMVIREGTLLAGVGIVTGIGGALVLTRFLRSMLFQIKPTDSATSWE